MKNSKQKTLRHGSAVFTDKHCLYRIAVVRYVDSLFYEPGDACRCHSRCYSLIVRELFVSERTLSATICTTLPTVLPVS